MGGRHRAPRDDTALGGRVRAALGRENTGLEGQTREEIRARAARAAPPAPPDAQRASLREDFPVWRFWVGVNGCEYAWMPGTSPPISYRGEDCADLRRQLCGYYGWSV
jgi:hypothetical protein